LHIGQKVGANAHCENNSYKRFFESSFEQFFGTHVFKTCGGKKQNKKINSGKAMRKNPVQNEKSIPKWDARGRLGTRGANPPDGRTWTVKSSEPMSHRRERRPRE